MNSNDSTQGLVLVAAALALACLYPVAATGQEQLIIKSNAEDIQLSLDPAFGPILNTEGNIEVKCLELDSNGRCIGLGSGTVGDAPEITFTAPAQNATIPASASNPALTWTVTGAQFCRGAAAVGGAVSGWIGEKATSGSFPLAALRDANADKTYTLTLGCYSAPPDVAYAAESRTFTMEKSTTGGGGDSDYCSTAYPAGIAQPSGFTAAYTSFSNMWGIPEAEFFPAPGVGNIGNKVGHGPAPTAGVNQYMVIPVDVPANAQLNKGITVNWLEPQASGIQTAEQVFISVSPCPGDFRAANNNLPSDPWIGAACRKMDKAASITMVAWNPQTAHPGWCPLVSGKRMYINVITTDVNANPPKSLCKTGDSICQVRMVLKQY